MEPDVCVCGLGGIWEMFVRIRYIYFQIEYL